MVNTKTTLSKKVLAVVLAVACMVAFTPAIAFTQSAHAANVAATGSGGAVSSIATAKTAFGTDGVTVTGTDSDITVTVNNQTKLTIGAPITIGQNIKLTVTSKATTTSDNEVVGSFVLGNGASLDIEGYTNVTPVAAGTGAGTDAIDGTSMGAGTITVGENATVTGGAAADTASVAGDAIQVAASTTTVTTTVGSVVVNGTVTKGATGTAGYGLNLGTTEATKVLVALSGTGTITTSNPADYGKWTATTMTTEAEKSATNAAKVTPLTSLVPGNVVKATANAVGTYTVDIYKTIGTTTTKVASSTGTTTTAAAASYVVTKDDATAKFTAKVYQAGKFGSDTSADFATVVKKPTMVAPTATASTVVLGESVTLSNGAVSDSTGTISYQWYKNTKNTTTGGTAIASTSDSGAATANASTYKFTPSEAGDTYFYVVATDTATGFTATSASAVKVTAQASGFTTDLKDVTYNMADTASAADFAVQANVTGTLTWYYNPTSASETGAQVLSKDASYAGTKVTPTNMPPKTSSTTADTSYYIYAQVKTAAGKVYTSKIAKVTFALSPSFDTTATDYNMSDATYAFTQTAAALKSAVTGAGTGATYQWYKNTTGTVDTSADTKVGSGTATYTPTISSTTEGTDYYYVVATQSGKTVTSKVAKITTVKEFAFTKQPASKTVMLNADAVLSLDYNLTDTATTAIQWYTSTTATTPTTTGELNIATTAKTATKITDATFKQVIADTSAVGNHYYFATVTVGGATYFTNCATVSVSTTKYPAKGIKFTSGSAKYKITKAATATASGSVKVYAPAKKSTKGVSIPASVTYSTSKYTKAKYNVTGIYSKAFAKSKATTVKVKSTKLTKAGVKNCFKGSKVKTVKVPKAKYKTYKKYFTKSNCGKKVTVKKF